jgi:nicotinamide-nucleotide adenylyltransferase
MTALFIGRFQPFHKGHLAAIKWILKKEGKIIIVIGSNKRLLTKDNPFYFKERKEMIEETLKKEGIKNFKIFGVHDYNNDIFWAKKILKITKLNPRKTAVFTKNTWTSKSFKKIGVMVKPHPLFLNKLSGTKVRNNIREGKDWRNLVSITVSDFLKEINCEKRIRSLNKC